MSSPKVSFRIRFTRLSVSHYDCVAALQTSENVRMSLFRGSKRHARKRTKVTTCRGTAEIAKRHNTTSTHDALNDFSSSTSDINRDDKSLAKQSNNFQS